MRVTFFLAHANLSGGVRVVATYARELARRGHDVTVVSTPRRPIPLKGRVGSLVRGRGWPSRGVGEASHLDGLSVRQLVVDPWRGLDPGSIPDADAIVATWWETASWVRDLPASKGAKLYFMQDYGAPGQPLERVVETWSYGLRMFTISRYLDRLVQERVPQEVEVIPNAVDLDVFRAPARGKQARPTVGFLYSHNPAKGTAACIEAIELARRDVPELRVVAFGPREPSDDLALPAGAEYRCRVAEAELREIYASCDAWLFATRREGFGLPILEAMACRTPVIGTPAGAAPELLGRGGGILVEPGDPAAMARAIVRVADMGEDEWRAMSDAGHRTATGWTWADAAVRLERLLERAVGAADSGDTGGTVAVPRVSAA